MIEKEGFMQLSEKGKTLIKKYEGLKLSAYKCPAGVWTIGYGHTAGVVMGQKISEKQADEFFDKDIKQFEDAVNSLVKVPLKQGQFDALVSFVYNVGKTAFANSTLLKLLNQKKYALAGNELSRWVYVRDKKLVGLVKPKLPPFPAIIEFFRANAEDTSAPFPEGERREF